MNDRSTTRRSPRYFAWVVGAASLISAAVVSAPLDTAGAENVGQPEPSETTLTIAQNATPDIGTNFRFGGGLGTFFLDDPAADDGDAITDSATFTIEPGAVRVRQHVFSRWNLDAITCTPTRNGPAVHIDKHLLVLDVEAGEKITCTFANSRVDPAAGTINARVGDDADADGRFDPSETWVQGSALQLFDRDEYPAGEIVTDADGRASIDVEAGAYTVCLTLLPGQGATRPAVSDDEQPCFDVTVTAGRSSWLRFLIARPQPGNDESFAPSISADGTVVTFASRASNLVADDTNGRSDVFLHDTATGTTRRISHGLDGESNSASFSPSISADGQRVVFNSFANNLVEGDTNAELDAFLYDAASDSVIRVNVTDDGSQSEYSAYAPVISADGSKIGYSTYGNDIVADDDGFLADVLLFDVASATTVRVSESTGARRGDATSPALPRDGTRIAYVQNIEDIFTFNIRKRVIMLHDTSDGTTVQVDPEPGRRYSENPSISADGTRVAYDSDSPTLVPGDANNRRDVFVYDTTTGTTISASVDSAGNQGDSHSTDARLSADGQHVTFQSQATNLVPNDQNGALDAFVRDIQSSTTTRVSVGSDGVEWDEGGRDADPSADGTRIAFRTSALPVGPTGGRLRQIYVRDTTTNTTILVSTAG